MTSTFWFFFPIVYNFLIVSVSLVSCSQQTSCEHVSNCQNSFFFVQYKSLAHFMKNIPSLNNKKMFYFFSPKSFLSKISDSLSETDSGRTSVIIVGDISLSLFLFVCLYLSFCFCLFVSLFLFMYLSLSFCLCLFVSLFLFMSVCLSLSLSVLY